MTPLPDDHPPSDSLPGDHSPRQRLERRLLLLTPTGKDAALTASVLGNAGIECAACPHLKGLVEALEAGAGAVLLVEEAIANGAAASLEEALARQPPWSDVPILVLTHQGADSATVARALQSLGNITLLERPTRAATLISAVQTALRGRRRQYELRDQLEALRRSERNLADFFENAAVGLHWVDAEGIILRVNQTELDLLGYTREEYLGHHIAEFHADADVIADILCRLHAGETLENCEARLRAKDGSVRHVLISSNVLWEDGQFIHTRCFTRDITPRKLAEEALREADRRKDEFLATLAHELRNPLAPIRNSLHILRLSSSGDPSATRVCEIMERQVNHMVRLVDDLLEVSRITRGKIELRKETFELAAAIRNAVEASRPLIDAFHQQLAISIPPEPILVEGDPVRLAQVFTNLLNNAAKYTDERGQIWLTVRSQGSSALISVRDNGVGIAGDMLPRVFDLFTQADRSSRRAQGGLGIGLSLVRSLVEMHGGSVEVQSAGPGQGSEFIVRLPLSADLPAGEEAPTDPTPFGVLSPRRVLVVDDNQDAADSLGMLLRLLGAEVQVVHDGPAALEALATYRPAVVLLDIGMPGMDGYQVARQIRQEARFRDVLLIALTGWSQEEDRERSRQAGFDHHLIKPPDTGELRALLSSLREPAKDRGV